jgi:hypothetical protein
MNVVQFSPVVNANSTPFAKRPWRANS